MVMGTDSVAILETGAATNLVCLKWLVHHNGILDSKNVPRVPTCPACARFKFGDARLGTARRAADILVGIAGNRGRLMAFAVDADILALLRRGAVAALVGQLHTSRDTLTLRKQGL